MSLPIFVVDAFIVDGNPFTGNPAGVCLLEYDDDIDDSLKQKIALEMNLSETAFVSFGWTKGNKLSPSTEDPNAERRTLRWFTPTNEVPLCGHATVASAKVIQAVQLKTGNSNGRSISFESKYNGTLGASFEADGSIALNFPSNPTVAVNKAERPWLEDMLSRILGQGATNMVADVQYSPRTKILFVRLKDEVKADGLAKVSPDFPGMLGIDTGNFVRDVIVTVKGEGNGRPDFYSRFFASWDGIDEDPVTGLAHTVLTPYWVQHLGKGNGPLKAKQHSTRGGDLICTLLGDRVKISGQARIGLKGELFTS
jgi:PhzF family phenazine biosynthesis protein